MKYIRYAIHALFIFSMAFLLPAAVVVHLKPGTPAVTSAFIDKASYYALVSNSYSEWLEMNARYAYQEGVLLEDIGLPNYWDGNIEDLLSAINFRVNNIQYMHDDVNWGEREYWSTPREMLDRGAGDCEDYAMLKFNLMLAAGYPTEHMFILVGMHNDPYGDDGGHAILAFRYLGDIWIMDNNFNSIIPLSDYRTFEPYAAINYEGVQYLSIIQY